MNDYAASWATYRRNSRARLFIWIAFIPACVFIPLLLHRLGMDTHRATAVVITGYLVLWGVLMARIALFRCPRCQKIFGSSRAKTCQNCGLAMSSQQ